MDDLGCFTECTQNTISTIVTHPVCMWRERGKGKGKLNNVCNVCWALDFPIKSLLSFHPSLSCLPMIDIWAQSLSSLTYPALSQYSGRDHDGIVAASSASFQSWADNTRDRCSIRLYHRLICVKGPYCMLSFDNRLASFSGMEKCSSRFDELFHLNLVLWMWCSRENRETVVAQSQARLWSTWLSSWLDRLATDRETGTDPWRESCLGHLTVDGGSRWHLLADYSRNRNSSPNWTLKTADCPTLERVSSSARERKV